MDKSELIASEKNEAGVNPTVLPKRYNRLKSEKSPYLLQHATNPVDWYPWSDEAFKRARQENKPVFLSIGYSTCHWCHVMAHESFEDTEVAKLMNESFISVKVDREERPDIDHVYMTVCQMMTGRGGWPLTIIMTPDKKPFFAATYLPKLTRGAQVGMLDLIPRIKTLWQEQKDKILVSSEQIMTALHKLSADTPGEALDESVLKQAYEQLLARFDEERGGFSVAPKFPTSHQLYFLMRYWKRTGQEPALAMVEKTLRAMRHGGIYDHVGFGFHRYATDARWLVPHFEKMLYDQALLALAYIEAYQITRQETYRTTVQEIFTYVLRDMTAPQGGFYSAEDADSEGQEGKFYLWSEQEIRDILSRQDADLIIKVFNINPDGNFKEEATGRTTGTNILHMKQGLAEIARDLSMPEAELTERLARVREKLFNTRAQRTRPFKDDKILTDWNGLMIATLARGARVFDEPNYARAAQQAVDFILERMCTPDGRLLHRYRRDEAGLSTHVDDYAFFIWGLLELYETGFEARYLKRALELNDDLIRHFWDSRGGGFFFTADDNRDILVRVKEIYDGAIPSGNAVAMSNLLRLARITGRTDLETKASEIGRAFARQIKQAPTAYTYLMAALDFRVGPAYEIVIAGQSQADDTRAMLKALRINFIPNKIVVLRPTEEATPPILDLVALAKERVSLKGKATAYVCTNYSCQEPTTEIPRMLELLNIKNR